jgi:hypothetical protein
LKENRKKHAGSMALQLGKKKKKIQSMQGAVWRAAGVVYSRKNFSNVLWHDRKTLLLLNIYNFLHATYGTVGKKYFY